jgi:hypothetical protein
MYNYTRTSLWINYIYLWSFYNAWIRLMKFLEEFKISKILHPFTFDGSTFNFSLKS